MRLVSAVLAATLVAASAAATPAAAQDCDCAPGASVETGPAYLVVPRTTVVPHTRYVRRTVLVPRTTYTARTRLVRYPAVGAVYGGEYPAGYRYGATYVPPGTTYSCFLGTVGCDSSAVGPLGF